MSGEATIEAYIFVGINVTSYFITWSLKNVYFMSGEATIEMYMCVLHRMK